jgi:hypothetical protein
MNRRNFLKNSVVSGSAFLSAVQTACNHIHWNSEEIPVLPISRINARLAIAMWDFSWILRHHRYGEFYTSPFLSLDIRSSR